MITKVVRFFKMLRNIIVRASKELLFDHLSEDVKRVISKYKFFIVIIAVICLFVFNNIYRLNSYNKQIEVHNRNLVEAVATNRQIKKDNEYYNSDTYIIKKSTEELGLRLVEPNGLYHEAIYELPEKDNSDDEYSEDSKPKDQDDNNVEDKLNESTGQEEVDSIENDTSMEQENEALIEDGENTQNNE